MVDLVSNHHSINMPSGVGSGTNGYQNVSVIVYMQDLCVRRADITMIAESQHLAYLYRFTKT